MDWEGEHRSVHFTVEQDHVIQCGDAYCAQLAGRRVHNEQTARDVCNILIGGRRAKNHTSKNALAKRCALKDTGKLDADFNVQDSALKGNIIELAIVVPQF